MAVISGGDKLEAKLKELSQKVSRKASVSVGFLEGSTYPDGTSTPMVAAIQNFGAPAAGIPPRPFFSNMVAEKSGEWGGIVGRLLSSHDYDAEKVMGLMGEGIKGQLQQSIKETNSPPLSPSTIERKGFETPLIDTGHMMNSVDYKVDTE